MGGVTRLGRPIGSFSSLRSLLPRQFFCLDTARAELLMVYCFECHNISSLFRRLGPQSFHATLPFPVSGRLRRLFL